MLSQLLTRYPAPAIYPYLDNLSARFGQRKAVAYTA
jgi:hypothetical protein